MYYWRCSAFKSPCLPIHILYNYIEYFAEGRAIFKHFPRLISVVMDFNEFFITNRKQAVALKVLLKIIVNFVLIKVFALNKKLSVIFILKHSISKPFRAAAHIFIYYKKYYFDTISAPNGQRASFASLKCCLPNGIPIIVTQSRMPHIKCSSASRIPENSIQTKFKIAEPAPPP